MSVTIHPSSVVHSDAQLGEGVEIGPFCMVGAHVSLGAGVKLHSHAVVDGYTTLHEGVQVYPFAAVGLRPQDKKYDGSKTTLQVGARTEIRESATLQPGSIGEGCGETKVGSDCLLMAYTHVAHDCVVGNNVILANAAQIAGHCVIEDYVILGGVTTVHQFVRIGTRAMTGASSRVQQDIPPYMTADGHPAGLVGLNKVGLNRAGVSNDAQLAIKRAYRALFMRGGYADAVRALEHSEDRAKYPEVDRLCRFLGEGTRGVMRARRRK